MMNRKVNPLFYLPIEVQLKSNKYGFTITSKPYPETSKEGSG